MGSVQNVVLEQFVVQMQVAGFTKSLTPWTIRSPFNLIHITKAKFSSSVVEMSCQLLFKSSNNVHISNFYTSIINVVLLTINVGV